MVTCERLAVFCGPSLPPEDRHGADGVTFLPPAARGDVERAAREFDAILLIDGVFHYDLAPSPKECYRAAQRVRAFGASSMGALRAAECAPYGFLPLGAIARWYAYEIIDGDDEVAVLVHPETHAALTVPSVNVRYVARLAQRRGLLTHAEAKRLIDESRAIFYMDRALEDVVALVPERARDKVRAIAEREGDLKRWDARFALRSVVRRLASSAPVKTD
jgi:TfuA protein